MNFNIDITNSKVLLVDDNPQNLTLLGMYLKKFKLKMAVALEGEAAYKTALEFMPDLILMDINMPVLDGFGATKLLKSNPVTEKIPIIFTTALSDTDNIIKAYQLGGVDYVVKPFKLEELYHRVKAHLEIKKLLDEVKKKNNELDIANKSKDKFFSIISHDLRSPFTATLMTSKLLIDYYDKFSTEDIFNNIVKINQALNNQYNLLEKLLDWSRVQTGNIEFKPTKIYIKDIINTIETNFLNSFQNKDIEFNFYYDKDLDLSQIFINADEFMINSIFHNLISNSIKFTPRNGKIIFDIELLENQSKIKFAIKDSGIGMNENEVQNLFKIDNQNTTLGTEKEKGTGLGLILVKEFVDKHNASIKVESQKYEGTKFTLIFDLQG